MCTHCEKKPPRGRQLAEVRFALAYAEHAKAYPHAGELERMAQVFHEMLAALPPRGHIVQIIARAVVLHLKHEAYHGAGPFMRAFPLRHRHADAWDIMLPGGRVWGWGLDLNRSWGEFPYPGGLAPEHAPRPQFRHERTNNDT